MLFQNWPYLFFSRTYNSLPKSYGSYHRQRKYVLISRMKFMKLGTRPDTFYTEKATRTVISDIPSDITIRINNITYLLHKYPLLPKCGLLQRLFSEFDDSSAIVTLDLHDIPGGEEAFELCAKFCYGITINLSAHNFVSAFCAAKFLGMTEAVENGNFVMKLEAFFSSCILEGWKDSIVALQNTERVYDWSENLGIIRRCVESIVDKILTPPTKVTWSYTYTRPGYDKKRHQMVPKDWWTEDISFLNVDMFRCIVAAIKSTNMLQPQLIGEAIHVYASRWLQDITESGPNEGASSQAEDSSNKKQKILETLVNLIPADKGSVSIKFLLKLLRIANFLAVNSVTKGELLRLSGLQFEEASLNDLLQQTTNDVDLVKTVLDSFLRHWKRQTHESQSMRSICKIGKLIDSYLQVAAKNVNLPVQKFASLAETLPGIARPNHDDLYMALNTYLKEHPDLSKTDKKQLCRILDCQKLSPEVRAHAVRNEDLPLRTVVQVLFFEQEKGNSTTKKKQISADEQSHKARGNRTADKLQLKAEPSLKIREVTVPEMEKGREIREGAPRIQLNSHEKALVRRISEKS